MSNVELALAALAESSFDYDQFMESTATFFGTYPALQRAPLPIVHSVKWRRKSEDHLREKIVRKQNEKKIVIDEKNVFDEITDVAGVRVLHLHQAQFVDIKNAIYSRIEKGRWCLTEDPKAYTWDPEAESFFLGQKIPVQRKDIYTSVHFLIHEPADPRIKCEIQVRTLFEEIWGEIDHSMNYPVPTKSVHCREQLKVLAKLVATGSRLADSLFRSHGADSAQDAAAE